MSGLAAPFILCPLAERKDLLGVRKGPGSSIVLTINKNMAIQYHVLDQKQERSWTSRVHWFTSPVTWIQGLNKFAVILNKNTLAFWEQEDTDVKHPIKIKFGDPLWGFLNLEEDGILLVFESGFVTLLPSGWEKGEERKMLKKIATGKGLIDVEKEEIIDAVACGDNNRIVLVLGDKGKGRWIQRRDKMAAVMVQIGGRIVAKAQPNEGQRILGHCVLPQTKTFLYLEENGRLRETLIEGNLRDNDETETTTLVGNISNFVSLHCPVVIHPTPSSSNVLIYGSDPSEEGAVVLLYDLKYDLVVARQGLKLYGNPPIMEVVGNNILIPVGLHVLVLALHNKRSLLSSVVGKHGLRCGSEVFEERGPFTSASIEWEVDVAEPPRPKQQPSKVKKGAGTDDAKELAQLKKVYPEFWEVVQQSKMLEKEGQPQALICEQILSLVLEKESPALSWMLQTFTDIPETFFVPVLTKVIPALTDNFEKKTLLELLLNRPVDPGSLSRSLRSLDFVLVKKLCLYLRTRISFGEQDSNADWTVVLPCYIQWLNSIMDAHYTNFVLYDETELVDSLMIVVKEGMECLEALNELQPYLHFLQKKIDYIPNPSNQESRWRTQVLTFF